MLQEEPGEGKKDAAKATGKGKTWREPQPLAFKCFRDLNFSLVTLLAQLRSWEQGTLRRMVGPRGLPSQTKSCYSSSSIGSRSECPGPILM